MYIYRHHTAADIIDFDDNSGAWTPVEEDEENPIIVGHMAMIHRAQFPIRGSYTIEDDKRYCFYWTESGELVFRTDAHRFALFRYDSAGSLTDLAPSLQATLEPATDGEGGPIPDKSTFTLIDGNGRALFHMSYNAQPYLQYYASNFTFAPDEDLSDWDFFIHVKRSIDGLRVGPRRSRQLRRDGE